MAGKKVVKKKTSKKDAVRKKNSKKMVYSSKRKINLVLKNLILFVILALVSFLLFSVSGKEFYQEFFQWLAIILGFIGLAFFLVLLILLLMRAFKK